MEDVVVRILKRNYERFGNRKVALRRKKLGIWQSYTWEDYYRNVKYFALGLLSLGFGQTERVSIIGDNDPEYYWAWLATQAVGGIPTGMHPDILSSEVKYYCGHANSTFVVAQDQEQVDKIIEAKEELPSVRKVIYWEPKGLWFYTEPYLVPFDNVIEMGKVHEMSHSGVFEDNVAKLRGEDPAALLYTSGTTGALPKASLVSHRSFLETAEVLLSLDNWGKGCRLVSLAPLSWGADVFFVMIPGMLLEGEVCFPEKPDSVREDMREIGPNVVNYGPRQWEQISSDIRLRMSDAVGSKKAAYRIAFFFAAQVARHSRQRKGVNLLWTLLFKVAQWIALRGLLDKQSLARAKYCYTGGSAISPGFLDFFQTLGIPLKQVYGCTEVGGVVSMHRSGDIKAETVGELLPGVEAMISDNGEILLRTPRLFLGYWDNPEATEQAIVNGWFKTGDGGHIDEDSSLVFLGRISEFRELSRGRKFPPEHIEIRLRFSPYIKDAIVVGGSNRDYVCTLININYQNCGDWAERNGTPYTTFKDLSQKVEIYDLIQEEIERVNKTIPEDARVRKFLCIPKELDPDEGELTRTRKLRRGYVEERYLNFIEALYSDKEQFEVELAIAYRDGAKSMGKTTVNIRKVQQVERKE